MFIPTEMVGFDISPWRFSRTCVADTRLGWHPPSPWGLTEVPCVDLPNERNGKTMGNSPKQNTKSIWCMMNLHEF